MQFFKRYSLAFISLLFSSCDPCRNLDCVASNYFQQFRILSAADNKDLIFGPNKIYDRNQIQFFSLQGADTTFFKFEAVKSYWPSYDSVLSVMFFPKTDTAFMKLNNVDIDTLKITYKTYGTKCCGTITEISDIKFNKTALVMGGSEPQELKK